MTTQPSTPPDPIDAPASSQAFSRLQRRLHWLVAVLLGLQFGLQAPMRDAVRTLTAGGDIGASGFLATTVHTWSGGAVGLMILWRLKLRYDRRGTGPTTAGLFGHIARLNHVALYATVLVMVTSGSAYWYFGVEPARQWHQAGKWVLAALVSLHVVAAAWHALVLRDDVFRRMTSRGGLTDRIVDRDFGDGSG